jgi:hypothetical protein
MKSKTKNQLLKPWTSVKVQSGEQGVQVETWGRTYTFANAPMPTSIITASEEVLSSPIRVVAEADGKSLSWDRKGIIPFRCSKAAVTLSGWLANESLIINTTTKVEFDGFMKMDMVVMAQPSAKPKLEKLWLEIPLRANRGALFTYWPSFGDGSHNDAINSGAISEDGLALPFKPFIWLGWEEGGLTWCAESDKKWQPKDANASMEVVKQGEEVILRFHILDSLVQKLPMTITFGLQATPVKAMPKDFHSWRIIHNANYGMLGELDRIASLGVKTVVFHENWTPIQNYWETTHEAELKKLIAECHKRKIKILLYFGFELSTLAPEWGEAAEKVLVEGPLTGGYYRGGVEQRAYIVCYNSKWQDNFVEGITQSLDKYGYDGIYLDSTIEPWGCRNERHGCGYRTPDGKLKDIYPVFAVRQLMQRLYTVVSSRGGIVNAHQSTCCITAILSFCHSYLEGEQFFGEFPKDLLTKVPLAAFRAEFTGKNFGVPGEFLIYEKPPIWTFERALAITLLHDVGIRPWGYKKTHIELMSGIWKALSGFSAGKAEWHPYWRNQQFIKTNHESVKVSFYKKKDGVLMVISNLSGEQEIQGEILLSKNISGNAKGFSSAIDAITGEIVKLQGDTLKPVLPPMKARLIRLQ